MDSTSTLAPPAIPEVEPTTTAAAAPEPTSESEQQNINAASTDAHIELPADRAVLVTDDDLLSSQFSDVLNTIFERFDINKDGFLNLAELQAFARASTGSDYPEDTLVVIGKLFADRKFLPVLQLPFKGFQGMHLLQVKINEHEVWSDLERLGYDHMLEAIEVIEVAELFPLES